MICYSLWFKLVW